MLEINRSLDNWLIDVKHGNCNELYKEKQTELWFEIQVETLAVSYQFSSLRIAAFVNAYVREVTCHPWMLTVLLTISSGSTNFCFYVP